MFSHMTYCPHVQKRCTLYVQTRKYLKTYVKKRARAIAAEGSYYVKNDILENLFDFNEARNFFKQGTFDACLQCDCGTWACTTCTKKAEFHDAVLHVQEFAVSSVPKQERAQFI